MGWHVISEEMLLDYLRRAWNGENPGILLLELYANADIERVEPEEET